MKLDMDMAVFLGAVKRGETFLLSNGGETDLYFDSKQLTLNPVGFHAVGESVVELLQGANVVAIGGSAVSAIPLVSAAVVALSLPGFYVMSLPKQHGTRGSVQGRVPIVGSPVAILDDVVTSGTSILHTVRTAERLGLEVVRVACLLDRDGGGRERLDAEGHHLYSVFTETDLEGANARRKIEG